MPNSALQALRNAIARQEGYGIPGKIPTRNNNPGDLHNGNAGKLGVSPSGETVYPTIEDGLAALDHQIQIVVTGTSSTYNPYASSLGLNDSSELTLAQFGAKYATDRNWTSGVARQLGVDPNQVTMGQFASGSVQVNAVRPPNGGYTTNDSPGQTISTNPKESTNDSAKDTPVPSTTAQPITGQTDLTQITVDQLDPQLQIDGSTDGTNLSETPWYEDQSLVTGNPRISRNVQPVSFTVFLDQTQPSQFLHKPQSTLPISIQLNVSLREFEIESRHVYNRTPSRTGMHITFWGMHPDLITGQGSTGVFMNQFGITDWFSVANIPSDMKNDVLNGLLAQAFPQNTKPDSTPGTPDTALSTITQTQARRNPSEAFRVAAQDAFVEFLKLFQMNGITWFTSPNYRGFQTGQDQQGPNAWSPKTGATSFQQTARNNDVMTRGYVAMQFRNNTYLGYFKSLNWTQDAEKPFSWEFNFAFQVEKTISALFYPTTTAQMI